MNMKAVNDRIFDTGADSVFQFPLGNRYESTSTFYYVQRTKITEFTRM